MPRVNVKDKRRLQLIEANLASVAKRGLAETTIAHVSEGAKMSRGIVNFYFASKENMMQQTLKFLDEELTSLWQTALEDAAGTPPVERLRHLIMTYFSNKICNSRRVAVWAAFLGHATTHAAYRKIIAASDERWKTAARALFVEGGKSKDRARHAADSLHAMARGLWLSTLLAVPAPNRKYLLELCAAYIAAEWEGKPRQSGKPISTGKKAESRRAEGQLAFEELLFDMK